MGRESRKNIKSGNMLPDTDGIIKRSAARTKEQEAALAQAAADNSPGEHIGVSSTRYVFEWKADPGERGVKLWQKPESPLSMIKPRLLCTIARVLVDRNPAILDVILEAILGMCLNSSRMITKLEADETKCHMEMKPGILCGQDMPCKDHPVLEPVIHAEPKGEM
jgi:hypothetical protein